VEYNPTERPENPFHKNFFESDFKEKFDGNRGFLINTSMKKASSY